MQSKPLILVLAALLVPLTAEGATEPDDCSAASAALQVKAATASSFSSELRAALERVAQDCPQVSPGGISAPLGTTAWEPPFDAQVSYGQSAATGQECKGSAASTNRARFWMIVDTQGRRFTYEQQDAFGQFTYDPNGLDHGVNGEFYTMEYMGLDHLGDGEIVRDYDAWIWMAGLVLDAERVFLDGGCEADGMDVCWGKGGAAAFYPELTISIYSEFDVCGA